MQWKFSRTMPQWPHWYVVGDRRNADAFRFMGPLIWDFGYPDRRGNRINWYLVIGDFKYWFDGNVLNRAAPISNAEVRKRGLKYAAGYGKKIGPLGRLVNDSIMRRKPAKNKMKETKDTWHELRDRVYELPNTRSDMTIKWVKRVVAKFLRNDITPDQIHLTPKGVHLCKRCRQKTDVNTLKEVI